jgi:hypothetical protein
MIFKNSGNTDISGTAIIHILNSTDTIQKYEHTFSELTPSQTIEFTDEWETRTEDNSIKIVCYVLYEGDTTPPVIEYLSFTSPTPTPSPTQSPKPSPEPESPKGISGFPIESIIIGAVIAAVFIGMMRIRRALALGSYPDYPEDVSSLSVAEALDYELLYVLPPAIHSQFHRL